jgi:hypothetical protein
MTFLHEFSGHIVDRRDMVGINRMSCKENGFEGS